MRNLPVDVTNTVLTSHLLAKSARNGKSETQQTSQQPTIETTERIVKEHFFTLLGKVFVKEWKVFVIILLLFTLILSTLFPTPLLKQLFSFFFK